MKLLAALLCFLVALGPGASADALQIFTSTREVRSLQIAPGGTLWAATTGGILRFDKRHNYWTKFTRREGLPSHEWRRALLLKNNPAFVAMDGTAVQYRGGRWRRLSRVREPRYLLWRGQKVTSTLDGISLGNRAVAAPAGGALVTAILPRGSVLLVALFGDGLWRYDGIMWTRAFPDLPSNARQITALAGDAKTLWLGTRREGIFRWQSGRWQQFQQADEPYFHNVQNAAFFEGATWFSTLEDGLVVREKNTWKHFAPPQISSNAPRHLIVFKGALYVRHGDGIVDRFQRGAWTKNLFSGLPRRPYALAADDKYLYTAAWGGWSQWDGAAWQHHFDVPQLQGVPLMGLLPDGESLWIATQSLGAGQWQPDKKQVQWLDERHGLPDDWVTTLARFSSGIFAGTFVGGLARVDKNGVASHAFSQLRGDNVTALEANEEFLYAGTRRGLWRLDRSGEISKSTVPLDSEIQALCWTPQGLWIGTRTSVNLLR